MVNFSDDLLSSITLAMVCSFSILMDRSIVLLQYNICNLDFYRKNPGCFYTITMSKLLALGL
jgi:hypothetical protein